MPGIEFPNGDTFQAYKITATNRTGAALSKGGVYALDLTQSATETTDAKKALGNVVKVAAGNIDGILVIATEDLADDETGLFVVEGPCLALVDGGTIDVAAGDKLIPTAASINLTKSDAITDIVAGKALEANTGAAALKMIYFHGVIRPQGTDETS
jgi:hypothetical protein